MDEHVVRQHGMRLVACAHRAGAGLHDEQFPLREMGVERTDRRAGGDAANLDVERMAAAPRAAIADTPECNGDVLVERMEFARGRMDLLPWQGGEVDVVHR